MKHIKPYKIFESQESNHSGFPNTIEEINIVCDRYHISEYTINEDLSIDVIGSVSLQEKNLEYLPLKFNFVSGDFNCRHNKLKSLKGCPKKVGKSLFVDDNKLTSLEENLIIDVGRSFDMGYNNITSLKGCPKNINGYFYCDNNNLTSLEYGPKTVGEDYFCFDNKLESLKHGPDTVGDMFSCNDNNIKVLDWFPTSFKRIEIEPNPINVLIKNFIHKYDNKETLLLEFQEYSIIRGDKVVLNRLKAFCNDFDLLMPSIIEIEENYKII